MHFCGTLRGQQIKWSVVFAVLECPLIFFTSSCETRLKLDLWRQRGIALNVFGLNFPFFILYSEIIDLKTDEDDDTVAQVSKEEDESEPSGTHANDAQNQPDPQGRVLVNLNHPSTEEEIFLSPQLARAVKPHQVSGSIQNSPRNVQN